MASSFNGMASPMGFFRFGRSGNDGEMNYKFDSKVFESEVNREYCLDAVFNDPKTANDVNIYKDVIKRLIEDLTKLRRENLELKETVLSFSKRLPQVFQSLSSLSTTIEAEAQRFLARKKRKSEEETYYSLTPSGEGSLNEEDHVEYDPRYETSDEESRQAVVSISDGVLHNVQNFVEILSEEDNVAEDGSRINMTNNAHASHGSCNSNYKGSKDYENKSSDTNSRTSLKNTHARNLNSLEPTREIISSTNEKIVKFSSLNADQNKSEMELNCVSHKETKKTIESAIKELQDEADKHIQMEESLEDTNKEQKPLLKVSSFGRPTRISVNIGKNSAERMHGQQRIFSCDICGRTFSRSSNLLHHAMRHRNERPHQCEICDRAFVQKANLKVHLRSHTGERPYACDECGKAFAQKNNALRHLRAHARQRQRQEKKLECPMCGKSFGRGASYEIHMRRAHSSTESQNVVDCAEDVHKAHSNVGNMNVCPPIVKINIPHHETPPQYIMQFSSVENAHSPPLPSVMPHPVLA